LPNVRAGVQWHGSVERAMRATTNSETDAETNAETDAEANS
jgi:hypothetical protein